MNLDIETLKEGDVTIYLLDINSFSYASYLSYLLPKEQLQMQQFLHPQRRKEFVATRVLRTKCFDKTPIIYSELNSPHLENNGFISISHTKDMVGIAHCSKFKVGLDIEKIREKVLLVKNKFLSVNEKKLLDSSSTIEMTKVWSGKEALYKLSGRNKIIFATQLLLEKKTSEKWKGTMCFYDMTKEVNLQIIQKGNAVLSINTSPVRER